MKIVTEALNAKVYEVLKQNILTKRFEPGSQLVESKISEIYGISRTPVREALLKLCHEGLIRKNGKSYIVVDYSREDICEICEFQKILAVYAVNKVIEKMTARDGELEGMIDEAYGRDEEGQEGTDAVFGPEYFHDGIVKLAGNTRLLSTHLVLRDQLRAFMGSLPRKPEQLEHARDYRREIYSAIKKRDKDQAMKVIEKHARLSREDVLNVLAEK